MSAKKTDPFLQVLVKLRGPDLVALVALKDRWNLCGAEVMRVALRFVVETIEGREGQEPRRRPEKVPVEKPEPRLSEQELWIRALRVLLELPPDHNVRPTRKATREARRKARASSSRALPSRRTA